MSNLRKKGFSYLKRSVKALGHTPIYKFHKYFARRPYNVFSHIIEFYTNEGDVILDSFCGGGVTVVEGTRLHRRVIGVDANPLAVFVTESQLTHVDQQHFKTISDDLIEKYTALLHEWFETTCRSCLKTAAVRWFENSYVVNCPHCEEETSLCNDKKAVKNGKAVNGQYICTQCAGQFRAVDVIRKKDKIVSLRYRCPHCEDHRTVEPSEDDVTRKNSIESSFSKWVKQHSLEIPEDEIPEYWDRQKEDCLHRKGFFKFSDFFTKRNLLAVALLKKLVQQKKRELSKNDYRMLLFIFSATLRYVNNLNFSTSSWMDGRPVAWAKHAYWTPNQFVEVNPIEYLRNRRKAFLSSLKYQNEHFDDLCQASLPEEVIQESSGFSHAVVCGDSASIDLPDNSVDAVITDPPYGSNVQYGELSSFWLVWLRDELDYLEEPIDISKEVLTHRKTKKKGYAKTFQDYHEGLRRVFTEAHRVLKKGGCLVFTFNNKNLNAWFAVIKACIDSGFTLEQDGLIYQDPIHSYRDTAHSRAEGALQGDFIYTFRKIPHQRMGASSNINLDARNLIIEVGKDLLKSKAEFSKRELHVGCLSGLISIMVKAAHDGHAMDSILEVLKANNVEQVINSSSSFNWNGSRWSAQ
jgi:adenine-specific DNA methylase